MSCGEPINRIIAEGGGNVKQLYRDPEKIAAFLEGWVREKLDGAGATGAVLGLSGGVDSAALAALLRRTLGRDHVLALIMPSHSNPQDEADARLVAEALDIEVRKIDLTGLYDAFSAALETVVPLSDMARANIKPRLRMTVLYAAAQSRNALVCGGGNRDELVYGYFTKHGDSGVDLLPFGELLKGEVWALAAHLGVPRRIVDKPPTAGLWDGQTDEAEMGVTYEALDRYLADGTGAPEIVEKIRRASARSAHKREMPPIAPIPLKLA